MKTLTWNLLLALAWTAITSSMTPANFALGMVIGFVSLVFARHIPGVRPLGRRAYAVVRLVLYTLWEILLANMRVTRDILAPADIRPALLSFETRARGDLELSLLVTLVTLTPGTTVVDVSADRQRVYVHFTNLPRGGPEQALSDLRSGFERYLLEATR